MRYSFYLLVFVLFSNLSFSQTITLKGNIQDPDGLPLESATVYLSSVKDSSVVDYTISNKNGNWELKTRKITQPVYLKISYVSFVDHKELIESLDQNRDFGTLKMKDRTNELDAIVVESEIPPIRIKKDTLEFNASSFKVRPDANVEALLKQLPGVEIDSDGKIKVNGQEVNQVLVNGKPFFDKDGKIALQNLPAEIIEKVQVTDSKTKKEELAGEDASGNNASINLTISEENDKGLFGKFVGGYGSDERYESSGLINYFKGKRKFSFLGSSNNINSTGFSMDEIFDNMRGGRNRSMYYNSDGGFGINGIEFGGNTGITRSTLLGFSYADEWTKGLDPTFNYFYNTAETDNANRTRQVTFLPNDQAADVVNARSLITESSRLTNTSRYTHNLNSSFEIKLDSTASIYFEPRFTKANSKTKTTSRQSTTDQDNVLQNESNGDYFTETDNYSFTGNLEFFKSFKKKRRSISISLNNENKRDDNKNINQSDTFFYNEDTNGDGINDIRSDIRNQLVNTRTTYDRYNAGIEYSEPITDSLRVVAAVNYSRTQDVENRDGYNFNPLTVTFESLNPELTAFLSSETSMITPTAGIRLNKNKYSFGITGGTRITEFSNYGTYLDQNYTIKKNYLLPSIGSNFDFRLGKSASIYLSYNYSVDFPQARQVLPIKDVSSALSTHEGNPDLDPNKHHTFYLGFYNFDYATRSGYNIYAGGSFYDSQVVANTYIDPSAKRFTNYTNVSGTYNTWFGIYWNKSIKKETSKFMFGVGFNGGISKFKGFTNQQIYESDDFRFSPGADFTYEYGELLTIRPSYALEYNESRYTNYVIGSASNVNHRFNLEATTYWPKHFVFGNDFQYSYNSNLGDGFKKDFHLWNTSLGYNFLKDKMMFKVKVYDVLNQNLGTSRNISPTSVTDVENTVLKRYVMFSLTFKIQKFGAKEKKEDNFEMW